MEDIAEVTIIVEYRGRKCTGLASGSPERRAGRFPGDSYAFPLLMEVWSAAGLAIDRVVRGCDDEDRS